MDDNYIINKFWPNKISIYKRKLKANLISKQEFEYLNSRFDDSDSEEETLFRIKYKIFERPVCKTCGKKVEFNKYRCSFKICCSIQCQHNNVYAKIARAKALSIKYDKNTIHGKIEIEKRNQKMMKTCINKYGTCYYLSSKDCKDKVIKKFGVDNFRKTEMSKQITSKLMTNNKEIQRKREITMLKRYGNKNPWHTQHFYNSHNLSEISYKGHLTKKKLGSYKQSKQENKIYELLKLKFNNTIRQYINKEKYPFLCDFFIPDLDLHIELHFHWTHGGHPFDKDNENDLQQLEKWKSKNTKFYNNAIKTWTERDPKKLQIAKENNLNWIAFYNENEFNKWFERQ